MRLAVLVGTVTLGTLRITGRSLCPDDDDTTPTADGIHAGCKFSHAVCLDTDNFARQYVVDGRMFQPVDHDPHGSTIRVAELGDIGSNHGVLAVPIDSESPEVRKK